MSLAVIVDGALCFVNQSQFVRLSVAEGCRRFDSHRDAGKSTCRRRGNEGEHRERDKKHRWNIKRGTEKEGGGERVGEADTTKVKETKEDVEASTTGSWRRRTTGGSRGA